ncbi:YoaH family protein [Escherichia coli]|nr:YoaH family protein [Escherichia coli]
MFAGLPSLTHEQQQKPSSGSRTDGSRDEQRRAIALVAEELRANHSGERIVARFEDEDE